MMHLENVDTKVLLNMVTAFSAYYGREYTPEELIDSRETIDLIKLELESRKKLQPLFWLKAIQPNTTG